MKTTQMTSQEAEVRRQERNQKLWAARKARWNQWKTEQKLKKN